MPRRDGINRRQVPQLKKALNSGVPVVQIAGHFNVEVKVIFDFAKGWGIKLKETTDSIALKKHDEMIEAEVAKRLAEREVLGAKPAKMELKPLGKGDKK
jgi:hypothetical protein